MQQLNVLRISPYFYFEKTSINVWDLNYEPLGGMQVQITELTKAISPWCHHQVVLTIGLPKIDKIVQFTDNTEVISVRLPQPKIKSSSKGMVFLLTSWALGTIIWAIKNKFTKKYSFDLVHHHTSDLLSTFISGPIIAKILNRPFVATIHCSPNFTFHPSTFLEKLFFPCSKYVEKYVVKKAKHIYVLTERMKQAYLNHGFVEPGKITIIPDGVDIELFRETTEDLILSFKIKYKIPLNKKIISYIGRIAPEKGWDVFIKAAKHLQKRDDFHFLVCGDGHTRHLLVELIRDLDLQNKFTCTGYIAHTEIPVAMSLSFCVILPSYHEELGGITLETMSCRRVIIASAVGGVPYVVKDGENGFLVPPAQPELLASKIIWLAEHPEIADRVAGTAQSFAQKNYTIANIAYRLYQNYLKMV